MHDRDHNGSSISKNSFAQEAFPLQMQMLFLQIGFLRHTESAAACPSTAFIPAAEHPTAGRGEPSRQPPRSTLHSHDREQSSSKRAHAAQLAARSVNNWVTSRSCQQRVRIPATAPSFAGALSYVSLEVPIHYVLCIMQKGDQPTDNWIAIH